MSDDDGLQTVQMLDDARLEAEVGRGTRRSLLERALVGAAGVAAGATLPPVASAAARAGDSSVATFGRVAVSTKRSS